MSESLASNVLLAIAMALPALSFAAFYRSRPWLFQMISVLSSAAVGWLAFVAYAVAARALALATASEVERLLILDADGAPLAFAVLLGWLPGLCIVVLTWAALSRFSAWARPHAL
jgi:hypothetical protein